MTFLCEVYDRLIIGNESEYYKYLATLRKKDDKSLYKKYTINNINLTEVNKILNDYISIRYTYFDFYFINCEFVTEFDNFFIANKKSNYVYNTDINNMNKNFLKDIDCFKSRGHKFSNINQMIINIISDRCKIANKRYMKQPMSMCERRIKNIIARNPHLVNSLDRFKNHPLIRK